MKKHVTISINVTLWCIALSLVAFQSMAQRHSVSAGGVVTGAGGTATYSFGLIDYASPVGPGGTAPQGIQQSFCLSTWYADADNDGYGNPLVSQQACLQPLGYVLSSSDCNDANPAINPTNGWNNASIAVCGQTYAGTTVGASNDLMPNLCGAGAGVQSSAGVWYKFIGTNGLITASLCGSTYDSRISIFAGNCAGLNCISGNDDFCSVQSQVTFNSSTGNDYYILVHGYNTSTGNFSLTLTCEAPCAPATDNDECANATPLTIETFAADDNLCATVSPVANPGGLCGSSYSALTDTWYSFTSGVGNDQGILLSTDFVESPVVSGSFYAALYTGSCDSPVLTNCGLLSLNSPTSLNIAPNTSYLLRVYGQPNQFTRGNFKIKVVECVTPITWYADTDEDGYGNETVSQEACEQPEGYVVNADDCDDSNNAITVQQQWYADNDGDGFGDANYGTYFGCYQLGFSSIDNDCNNQNAALNPNTIWYEDADGDGFGNPNVTLTGCDVGSGYVLVDNDCNDANASIRPNATEVCGNGVDDDCNGNVDENCECTAPQNLLVSNITTVSATVSWNAVNAASSYQVWFRKVGDALWLKNTVNLPALSRGYSGLLFNTTYEWMVRAKCGADFGPLSAVNTFNTSNVCPVPSNLTTSNITSTSVKFNWTHAPGATEYKVEFRVQGTTGWSGPTVLAPANSFVKTNLLGGTTYEWRIRSKCGTVFAVHSDINTFTTLVQCGPPASTFETNITATSARLNWSDVVLAQSYQVQYRAVGATSWINNTVNSPGLFQNANDLSPATSYEWRLRSKCSGTWGSYTTLRTFTTPSLRLDAPNTNTPWAFSIHPNPSNGHFTVTPLADVSGLATVQLVDIAGRVILNQTWNASEDATLVLDKQLDLGLYMLNITAGDGQQFSSRVVIAN